MVLPVGLTDGLGTVVEEDELDDSFVNSIGSSVASQFVITPESGGYVPPPAPAPAPITPEAGGNYVPPEPSYFESDTGFTEYDQGPAYTPLMPDPEEPSFFGNDSPLTEFGADNSETWLPDVNYITNDEFFTDLYTGLPVAPVAPVAGQAVGLDGSWWFGDEAQQKQQVQWWQSEIQKALNAGDITKYNELIAEYEKAEEGWGLFEQEWSQYEQNYALYDQQFNALDTSVDQAFAFDPRGEGGFTRQREMLESGDLTSFLVPNEDIRGFMDATGTPQRQQQDTLLNRWNAGQGKLLGAQQAEFGSSLADIDAEAEFLGIRDSMTPAERQGLAHLETFYGTAQQAGGDLRGRERFDAIYNQMGSDALRRSYYNGRLEGAEFYGKAPEPFMGGPVGDLLGRVADSPVGDVAKGTYDAYTAAADKLGRGVSYGLDAVDYYVLRPDRVDKARAGDVAFTDYARERYEDGPGVRRFLIDMVADPLNYVPFAAVGRGVRVATTTARGTGDVLQATKLQNRGAKVYGKVFSRDETLQLATQTTAGERAQLRNAADLVNQGMGFTVNSSLDLAFAQRVIGLGTLHKMQGGVIDTAFIRARQQELPDLARRIGATEKEVRRIDQWVRVHTDDIIMDIDRGITPGHATTPAEYLPTTTGTRTPTVTTKPNTLYGALSVPKPTTSPVVAESLWRSVPDTQQMAVVFAPGSGKNLTPGMRDWQRSKRLDVSVADVAEAADVPRQVPLPNAPDASAYAGGTVPTPPEVRRAQLVADDFPVTDEDIAKLAQMGANPRVVAWDPIALLNDLPPSQRTVAAVQRIGNSSPPSLKQLEEIRKEWRKAKRGKGAAKVKQAKDAEHLGNLVKENRITAKETGDMMDDLWKGKYSTERAAELVAKGHDVPIDRTHPDFYSKIAAANESDTMRREVGKEVAAMLPKSQSIKGDYVGIVEGTYGGAPVMDYAQLHLFLYGNFDQLPAAFKQFANDIIQQGRLYVGYGKTTAGKITGRSANRYFADRQRLLLRAIENGDIPMEQVQAFKKLLDAEYFGSKVDDARLLKASEDRLAAMDEVARNRLLERVARSKAENDQLMLELKQATGAAKGDRKLADARVTLSRKIEDNSAIIRQVEPLYRPTLPVKPASEAMAASDEVLKSLGADIAPTTPPERGFVPESVGSDSTNDMLRNALKHKETAIPRKIVIEPKRTSIADADVAGFRSLPAGSLRSTPGDTNYRVQLSEYTDRLYHETSAMEASFLVEGTNPQMEIWFSNDPSLALGQGGKGVLVEFAPDGIMGQVNRSKPAWEYSWREAGTAEFYTPGATMAGTLQRNIRSVTIAGDVEHSRSTLARLRGQLQRRGWVETNLADGSSRYTPPTASSDIAAGGGAGIVRSPRDLPFLHMKRTPQPVIDFEADAWAKFDFGNTEQVKAFDKLLDRTYDYSDLVPESLLHRGNQFSRKFDYPVAKQTQVIKHADLIANYGRRIMSEAYTLRPHDPEGYVKEMFAQLANPSLTDAQIRKIDPFFTTSRHGREALRVWRRHGNEILNRWHEFSPYDSIGKLGNALPTPANGDVFSGNQMAEIHKLFSAKTKPAAMSDDDWTLLQHFKGRYKADWHDKIVPEFSTPSGRTRTWRDTSLHDIDSRLFPDEAELPVDIPGRMEQVASVVAEMEAKRIGFDPNDIPYDMRLMQVVKGNMVPLWMTLNPAYTLNNTVGNVMSLMLGAMKSDTHVGPNFKSGVMGMMRPNPRWKNAVDIDPKRAAMVQDASGRWVVPKDAVGRARGGGITTNRYVDGGLISRQTELTDAAFRMREPVRGVDLLPDAISKRAKGKAFEGRAIPKVIDKLNIPGTKIGLGGYHDVLMKANDAIERHFKKTIYSQEFMWRYNKAWSGNITALPLSKTVKDDLAGKVGMGQVQSVLARHNVALDIRQQVLAAQRGAVSEADFRAYHTTKTILRDYRMRNRADGFLDRLVPVHYWATKNMLFVGSVIADRPGLMVAAAGAYDAWQKQNEDLPPSLRTGMVPIPGEMIPWFDDDRTYYGRVTNLTNPALFAIPKMLNPDAYNWEGTSLPDRLLNFGMSGMSNALMAAGYRLGPQFDYAEAAVEALATNLGVMSHDNPMLAGWRFLVAPGGYYDYDEQRMVYTSSGRNEVLPIVQTQLQRWEPARALADHVYQTVYGSPYSRLEVMAFYQRATELQMLGEIDGEGRKALELAMANGQWDDPAVRDIIDDVMDDRANLQLVTKAGASGKEYTRYLKESNAASAEFGRIKDQGGQEAAERWAQQNRGTYEPYFRQWLDYQIATGGIDPDDAAGAITDVITRGNLSNPLFVQAAASADRVLKLGETDIARVDMRLLEDIGLAERQFNQIAADEGWGAAYDFVEKEAPWLVGKWNANDEPEKVIAYHERQDEFAAKERAYDAAREERRAKRREQADTRNALDPYYDRIDNIRRTGDEARRRAGDDPVLLGLADRAESDMIARVYNEIERAGLTIVSSDNLPRQTFEMNELKRTNPEVWEEYVGQPSIMAADRENAQRGHLLDLAAAQVGLDPNDYRNEAGYRDRALFDEAVAELAPAVIEAYQELAQQFIHLEQDQGPLKGGLHVNVLANLPNEDDVAYHLRDKYPHETALNEQEQADKSRFFDMPDDTDEERKAKNAEAVRLQTMYGEDFLDRTYKDTYGTDPDITGPVVTTSAEEHREYAGQVAVVRQWAATLSPADKAAFKEQYPDAFGDKDGVFVTDEGEEVRYDKFHADRLTTEQIAAVVAENGIDTPLGRGDLFERGGQTNNLPGEAERQRQSILVDEKKTEFRDMLPDDLQILVDMERTHKEEVGSQMIELDGQQMTFEDATQMLMDDPRAKTKKGFPSYVLAAKIVGEDSELGQYILTKKQLNDDAKVADAAQVEWWNAQPDDVKEVLLNEDPQGFGWLADMADRTAGTPVSGGGEPGATTTTSGGGKSSRPWVDYPDRTSSPRTSYPRTSSSGYRGGGGGSGFGSSGGSGDQPVLNQILSLDPFLATGEDDGRRAVAIQVSDWVQRMVSVFSMFSPDKRDAMHFQGLWMQLIGRMLGPNPDINSWMALLARLTKSGQPQQPPQGPQGQPSPPVEPVGPPAADSGPQARSTLGAY